MEYVLLIIGIIVLVSGGHFLVKSAVGLNMKFKLSPLLIGTTVVSIGTSAPELVVSIKAVLGGNPDIAVGNVIGSNIANFGLVLGITIIFRSVLIDPKKYLWSWGLVLLSSIMFLILGLDGHIDFFDGILLLIGLLIFLWFSVLFKRKLSKDEEISFVKNDIIEGVNMKKLSSFLITVYFIFGGLGLYFGSELLIDNAVIIATKIGVSQFVIGVSVIALGTSLPELATSIIAITKGHQSISLGNLLGSNIFNIFAVLGITSLIKPLPIKQFLLFIDLPIMIGFVLLVGLFMFLGKKMGRIEGFILIVAYTAYIMYFFI